MKPPRTRFEGVRKILEFNWPQVAGGAAVSIAGMAFAAMRGLPLPLRAVARAAGALSAYWTVSSLAASHAIYDRSGLFGLDWLARQLRGRSPRRIANVHSGFDETSELLRARYPAAELVGIDFYDPAKHTEPSIWRARKRYPAKTPPVHAAEGRVPLPDASFDVILLILAAHEIREDGERGRFFAEMRRLLEPGGSIIVVEHLRDAANFTVFGPGFIHFHSHETWLKTFSAGGLSTYAEARVTAFLRVFHLKEAP